jgi:hypothetical protein
MLRRVMHHPQEERRTLTQNFQLFTCAFGCTEEVVQQVRNVHLVVVLKKWFSKYVVCIWLEC